MQRQNAIKVDRDKTTMGTVRIEGCKEKRHKKRKSVKSCAWKRKRGIEGAAREGEEERFLEEIRACKKEQLFTVHINLRVVSSRLCTRLSFLCDLLSCAALSRAAGRAGLALSRVAPAHTTLLPFRGCNSYCCSLGTHANNTGRLWLQLHPVRH